MPDLFLNGRMITYTLRRSARRCTIGLVVDRDGLTVTAPQRLALRDVQAAVQQKARWVLAKLDRAAALPAPAAPRRFVTGEALPYRGGTLTLIVRPEAGRTHVTAARHGDALIGQAGPDAGAVEPAVRQWFRQEAAALLQERTACFTPLVGAAPARVTVKEQRRRWGSCSARGAVALNWRLVLAPPAVADFVVVHELCHLRRMDHSPAFWELVAGILPSWKAQRAWLREHGATLTL
jgi:predicted metal-dependent hydrolase